MTNLLLKPKLNNLNGSNSREKERERGSDSLDGEFWEAAGIYIPFLVSIQSSLN